MLILWKLILANGWGSDMVAAAVVGAAVVGGVASSQASKGAANTAAGAQTAASNAAISQQNAQFAATTQLLAPYNQAGTLALTGQQNLLGINGFDAQQNALNGIQGSSQFQTMLKQGENSILQNASATGGLRGGNTQSALAQFSPQLLNSLVQQQYANLGGMVSVGQNAAAGVGNAGTNNANQISSLLSAQGSANAGAALANGQANSQLYNGIGSALGTYAGQGGFSSLGSSSGYNGGNVTNELF